MTNFKKKDSCVVCVNSANFFHPFFDLIDGRTYLVHDVVTRPSLLGKPEVKLVFQASDGSFVELSSKRFKPID